MPTPRIIQCDARALPLDAASVDLVVTSPPFYGMRSYQDGGRHYEAQLGAEATPAEFVASLIECTREMLRVLKPTGSLWVNLGDKYSGRKSLIGIPWRYALRCIDHLGLILRAEVIWSKPNGLPESVRDRVKRSHETWFHFVQQPRYYSAIDEIREQYDSRSRISGAKIGDPCSPNSRHTIAGTVPDRNSLGKLPGSVWTVASQPLRVPAELGVDHFAPFPMELPRRIILGWSPREVCATCGEGRRPIVERGPAYDTRGTGRVYNEKGYSRNGSSVSSLDNAFTHTISGYDCACPDASAPSTPGVVLDPFGGTGTTALIASVLGRQGITVDASADYCRVAEWRCADERQQARALRGNAS